jgi:hypothetical protein
VSGRPRRRTSSIFSRQTGDLSPAGVEPATSSVERRRFCISPPSFHSVSSGAGTTKARSTRTTRSITSSSSRHRVGRPVRRSTLLPSLPPSRSSTASLRTSTASWSTSAPSSRSTSLRPPLWQLSVLSFLACLRLFFLAHELYHRFSSLSPPSTSAASTGSSRRQAQISGPAVSALSPSRALHQR